ncbi:hypothetical protein IJH33_00135 [Candidatus Saccharibacteria bacterium]|nr:hypothetical protein [Candidatus Saccharibacteria bacterium]
MATGILEPEYVNDPKNLLLLELARMEELTRKGGKRKTCDTHGFEMNLIENLTRLSDALWDYEYSPTPGTAHIVWKPVQREIFAAPYQDRIVHTYVVLSVNKWWDKRLSPRSFSCRVGKGTQAGIFQLWSDIRGASRNYSRIVYIIKLDILGYFMHIRRDLLYKRVIWGLDRQFEGNHNKRYKILKHAISEIIFDDPVDGVKIQGSYEDWRGLPEDKSLFVQPPNQGMVIGNFTSQSFSNVYLDLLDRFIVNELGYHYYGRYVDDFYMVVTEDELPKAKRDIKAIGAFLNGMGLTLNAKKTRIISSRQGVPFLGMVVRENAIMPGERIERNFGRAAYEVVAGTKDVESLVSYLGMLVHYDATKVCEKIFSRVGLEYNY